MTFLKGCWCSSLEEESKENQKLYINYEKKNLFSDMKNPKKLLTALSMFLWNTTEAAVCVLQVSFPVGARLTALWNAAYSTTHQIIPSKPT